MPHGLRPLPSCSLFSVVPLCWNPPCARRWCSEWYLFKICASLVRFYSFDGSTLRGGHGAQRTAFVLWLITDIHPRVRSGRPNGALTGDTVQCSGPFPSDSHFTGVAWPQWDACFLQAAESDAPPQCQGREKSLGATQAIFKEIFKSSWGVGGDRSVLGLHSRAEVRRPEIRAACLNLSFNPPQDIFRQARPLPSMFTHHYHLLSALSFKDRSCSGLGGGRKAFALKHHIA